MKKQMSAWVVLSALAMAVPATAQEAAAPKPVNGALFEALVTRSVA